MANVTIQLRRGQEATWEEKNPILAYGEPGYVKETGAMKIGDGETAWNELPAFGGANESVQADWEQNDASAGDYIKNKPFEEVILQAQTLVTQEMIEEPVEIFTDRYTQKYYLLQQGDPEDIWPQINIFTRYQPKESIATLTTLTADSDIPTDSILTSSFYDIETYPLNLYNIDGAVHIYITPGFDIDSDWSGNKLTLPAGLYMNLRGDFTDTILNIQVNKTVVSSTKLPLKYLEYVADTNLHAEAFNTNTFASGKNSHAEGEAIVTPFTLISGEANATEYTLASDSLTPISEGYVYLSDGTKRQIKAQYGNKVLFYSTLSTTDFDTLSLISYYGGIAEGDHSHSEGLGSRASGIGSHAEGRSTEATGDYSHAEGGGTTASGARSHAEGRSTTASGESAHTEGYSASASGDYSHAEGYLTTARGNNSHAEGYYAEAGGYKKDENGNYLDKDGNITTDKSKYVIIGNDSHAEGYFTTTEGEASHAEGYRTKAEGHYQHVQGKFNIADKTSAFIIGNGEDNNNRSNAMTVDWKGNLNISGEMTSATGADYAEYFEWLDGNIANEDRVGYLVSLSGDKITFAQPGDDILGIISGTAAVVGDTATWDWAGKYQVDKFGRTIWEMVEEFVEVPEKQEVEIVNENGETVTEIQTVMVKGESVGFFPHRKLAEDFDPSQTYIPRSQRPEWDCVGLMGKIYVRDDGSCVIGEYATAGIDGKATYSANKTNMRVMQRIDDNIVLVFLK